MTSSVGCIAACRVPSGTHRAAAAFTALRSPIDCRASSYATFTPEDIYAINPKSNVVSCKVPANLPKNFPRFTDFLFEKTERFSDRDVLVCSQSGRKLSHSQLRHEARAFGSRLVEREILKNKNDSLSIVCPNSIEFAISFFGTIAAGGVISPTNPVYVKDELAHNFHLAEPKGVVTTSAQLDAVLEAIDLLGSKNTIGSVIVTDIATERDLKHKFRIPQGVKILPWGEFNGQTSSNAMVKGADSFSQDDLVVLPFSSGTTGLAKGVHLSHKSLAANILQMSCPGMSNIQEHEILVGLLPFFHIYGMNAILGFGIYHGGTNILLEKFEPSALLNLLLKYEPTLFHLVPPILNFLARSPDVKEEHLASLKTITCGAAPAPVTVINELIKKFPGMTASFQEGYGMTEASPVTHWIPYGCKNFGSCGGPLPDTRSAIRDVSTDKFLGSNKNGEIVVQGPQVMICYHKNPSATADTLTEDRWLKTGDIGYYDDKGFFYVVDRVKELIKVKGLQVAPAELEDILHKHPSLSDAAVVGIPHDKLGEAPRAFVVPKMGSDGKPVDVDPVNVQKMVEEHVSEHKYLAGGVEVVESLPKSLTGKILRRQLKADYLKKLEGKD
ncbi:unnamed protein product [Notodromas monacha]|uniref:4-coumarate--CoA ligase n=1 Tax=Notodromas monacha TaxID=399045 RepID=A0A7R9GAN4_9CRUS|nr:unnamed protein product [Notodromas monacha]CAG0914210.1 unnamed protein product [Notodromas monacha]